LTRDPKSPGQVLSGKDRIIPGCSYVWHTSKQTSRLAWLSVLTRSPAVEDVWPASQSNELNQPTIFTSIKDVRPEGLGGQSAPSIWINRPNYGAPDEVLIRGQFAVGAPNPVNIGLKDRNLAIVLEVIDSDGSAPALGTSRKTSKRRCR
jgi:hypothetical protein